MCGPVFTAFDRQGAFDKEVSKKIKFSDGKLTAAFVLLPILSRVSSPASFIPFW
jgi:hypothetical protein